MHTDIFNNIDLLIEMAGSTLNSGDIESDLIQINKEIQDKKQKIEDLKSMMNDARYFNASNELVDKNIEVSLKSKITRQNRKIKDIDFKFNDIKAEKDKLDKDVSSLKSQIEDNKKYVHTLSAKLNDTKSDTYQAIVANEENHLQHLEDELRDKNNQLEKVEQEVKYYEQAKEELIAIKKEDEARLKEVVDNLNNPNAYIDEDLKKQDEEELNDLNESLEELQKKKLEYLTDPNMIGADAKELVINNNYSEALNKIKELVTLVKAAPFMDITNLSVLDEELDKRENERTELANYIDSKNYAGMNSDAVNKRIEYLNGLIAKEQEEINRYQATDQQMNGDIENNLSVLIQDLETDITKLKKEIDEYRVLLKDQKKSRKTKANLENAIGKKEKEQEVLEQLLNSYKKDLLFQITISNTMNKIVQRYNRDMDDKKKEIDELNRLAAFSEASIDYIEEEKDKEKLKKINEEIKQIKNRKKFTKTADEIYDEIEMVLANDHLVNKDRSSANRKEEFTDLEIDDLFDEGKEEPRIKVVEMIPAQTVQSDTTSGGASYEA